MLPNLRTDQKAIIEHPAKRKAVAAGRRFGKTVTGGTLALALAAQGLPVAWCAPTYANTKPLWKFTELHTMRLKAARLVSSNKHEGVFTFPGGGSVNIFSMDNPTAILGGAYYLVVIDEAAKVKPDAVYDYIEPTVADFDGIILAISTPEVIGHWFWQWYMWGQDDDKPDFMSWSAPTTANPLPAIQRYAERFKTIAPQRSYRQQILAEFLQDGNGVFSHVNERAHATPQDKAREGQDHEHVSPAGEVLNDTLSGRGQYVIGCDWGRVNDATVFAVMDISLEPVELCHMVVLKGMPFEQQKTRLKDLHQRFNASAILAEQNSFGHPLIEELQADGLPVIPFKTTNATKQVIVDALALALENGDLLILDDNDLKHELLSYSGEMLDSGLWRYSAPSGMHDDRVIATMLAWQAAKTHHSKQLQTAPNPFFY